MMNNKITRTADISFETRNEENTQMVEGLAVVFNQPTQIGWFEEVIEDRAFDEADMKDCVLLFNHDANIVLAGTKNNSLSIEITPNGLLQRATLIDTQQGNDIFKLVKSGLINKMSFAFSVAPNGEQWETKADGTELRKITKIEKVWDLSLVTYPAYEQTIAFARSQERVDELAEQHKVKMQQDKKLKELIENGNFE